MAISLGQKIPKNDEDYRLVQAVVDDNVGRRPVYVLGPPESLQTPWLATILARYYRVVASNVSAGTAPSGPSNSLVSGMAGNAATDVDTA